VKAVEFMRGVTVYCVGSSVDWLQRQAGDHLLLPCWWIAWRRRSTVSRLLLILVESR